MTEKDFIMAWLLAARAGSDTTAWSESREHSLITQARRIYKLIQWEMKDETDR
jgi:hypothetical protein